jgi:hypothetical protein
MSEPTHAALAAGFAAATPAPGEIVAATSPADTTVHTFGPLRTLPRTAQEADAAAGIFGEELATIAAALVAYWASERMDAARDAEITAKAIASNDADDEQARAMLARDTRDLTRLVHRAAYAGDKEAMHRAQAARPMPYGPR